MQPTGHLLLSCEPSDAILFVDDRLQGSVAALQKKPLVLPEGMHRLEFRREGYFAHFSEVRLVKATKHRLEIKLRKEPY